MSETTYEEATRCPKCGTPGEVRQKVAAPREAGLPSGTTIHTVYCVNGNKAFGEDCKWFDTCWMVQVNADGTIPPPTDHKGQPKMYSGFEGHDEAAQRLINSLTLQTEAEVKPGSEIRNPFGGN